MEQILKEAAETFIELIKDKSVKVISHYDCDGITSAAIMAKILKKLDKKFSIKIVKNLEKDFVKNLKVKEEEIIIFLDLASSTLEEIGTLKTKVFVIDHHEISSIPAENTIFVNPHSINEEEVSSSGLVYLFSKQINGKDKDLANLAVVGMVGDMLDRRISKLNNLILKDAEIKIKRSILLYPATRPINKTLEFSSSLFIPGITGNSKGAANMLREIGIKKENDNYKSLIELDEEELGKLITAILLRTGKSGEDIIGNIYLINFFNKLEDAREISAMINACSRLGYSNIALSFCLGDKKTARKTEDIYAKYKQQIISALNYVENNKIEGRRYIIINAKDNIKDTIVGTIASIMSMSFNCSEGTIIAVMAYDKDKIKVSARIAGRNGRNVREILEKTVNEIGGECGGHAQAAGCLIKKDSEKKFIESLIKNLELEVVKI